MARDRKRAKKRRRTRRGTPVPNPLDHASSGIDEAHLAETGAPAPPVGGEPSDVTPAPDQVEGDLVPASYEQEEAYEAAQEGETAPFHRRTIAFLGHVIDELRRVQWPNRKQTIQGTAVTLGFVVIAGGYLGLLDAIWQPFVEFIV